MRIILTTTVIFSLFILGLISFTELAYADVPPNFSDALIVQGLDTPTAMEVSPDGRIFVSEKCGDLRVIKNGVLLSQPFVSIPVNCQHETGLLGIAFDPNFESNGFVYVFYVTQNNPTSVVSRFTADPANPDVALAGSEVSIFESDLITSWPLFNER